MAQAFGAPTFRWLTASLLLAVSAGASAQDCEPYTAAAFAADLDALTPLFEAVDLDTVGANLATMKQRMLCLSVVVPRADFGRYARSQATAAFFGQDEDAALRWGRAAKFADVGGAWPSIIPEGHPATSLPEDVGPPLWGGPDDMQFEADRGDGMFANGVLVERPRLASEVPFLMQRFDKRERLQEAHWQDGAAFPDASLTAGTGTLSAPKWFDAAAAAPQGLGEAESFSMTIDTGEPDPTVVIVEDPEPAAPVDDRPVEERAREAYERAIGIADMNEVAGREKITDFMSEFGDSGIPEVADARRWLERHPDPNPPDGTATDTDPVDDEPTDIAVTPPAQVEVPDRPPRERTPRERTGKRGSPGLRVASLVIGGSALAMYGGSLGTRAAYNANPSDGLRTATNGLAAGATGTGAVAAGMLVTSFLVGGGK